MKKSTHFSEADLKRIEEAVKKSEVGTSGEIVPVFVEKCGRYTASVYKGSLIFSLITFLILILIDRFVPGMSIYDPLNYLFGVGLMGLAGGLLVYYVPAFQRSLVGPDNLQEMAFHKANQFFLNEEVFKTRDRTGIMIFVAWFEHQVIVMADKGISKVVEQDSWDHIVDDMVKSIKKGELTQGMEIAIGQCAEILREKGIEARPDDTDELSNKLRTES
ncbi:MAG: TPM domain-containing protein [Bacteroidetes bacterium]|nr:TPM domain-containing protein [Bacteroidota bacterium]MCB0841916.1 TPM domain-containing protein [Bacteroidota bacterium]